MRFGPNVFLAAAVFAAPAAALGKGAAPVKAPVLTPGQGRAANGAAIASATGQAPRVASGRLLKTFWYVPDVHRWVKSEEDTFNSGGVQTQQVTSELEAYMLANAPAAAADAPAETGAPAPAHHARTDHAARKPPAAPPQAAPATAPPLLQEMRLAPGNFTEPPSPAWPNAAAKGAVRERSNRA